MMLEGSNSSSAISWVREDLDECLESVRDNLEVYAEDTSRREPLLSVQEQLECLNLTFTTMQQQGASILTDEMIAVGGHMLHNGNANCEESLNALTDAVIVLPSYLDRLQAGHEDLPILLLPTLNELRATYDESLLSEGTLFAPELDVIVPELSGSEADAIATRDFGAFSKRVRSLYQGALLAWLKEQSKDSLLGPMQSVCRKLYVRLGRNDLRRLWWIAELAMQGLRDGSIDNDLPLRRLFARLDLTLKAMTEGGEDGPSGETVIALSRALLFYAAQARPGSKATDTLRKRFRLEELIPDRDALLRARGAVTGRDASLFHSIGQAIREELSQVKDTLDIELRTGRVDAEQRVESVNSLRQLADTLLMLNLPVPAKAVEDLLPALEETDGVTNMDLDSPLLALAQKLLEVEAILNTNIELLGEPEEEIESDGLITLPPHEQRQILSQMLDECVTELQQAQEAIRKRLEGETDVDYSAPLALISGALKIASQGEVSSLTEKLDRTLNAALMMEGGEIGNLEALTDAVAALELYLAGCRDEQANSLRFVDIMHQRLDGLPEAGADGEVLPSTRIRLPEKPAAATEPAPSQAPVSDVPDIDPAMLGVFLDEFGSVQAQLMENLPAWLENAADSKAGGEIRRGFHTLKGSGRMVGATEIGDFAWSFEDLLNTLADKKIEFSQQLGDTVTLGIAALEHMKSRLLGTPCDLDDDGVRTLEEQARQLAAGNIAEVAQLQDTLPASLLSLVMEVPASAEPEAVDEPATSVSAVEETDVEAPAESRELQDLLMAGEIDPTLKQLMIGEIKSYLSELEAFVEALSAEGNQAVSAGLVRAVHTLAGTLGMAPLGQETEVAHALETYLDNRLKSESPVTASAAFTVQTCLHRFHQRLSVLEDGNAATYPLDDSQLLEELAELMILEVEEAAPTPEMPEAEEPIAIEAEFQTDEPVASEDIEIATEATEEQPAPVTETPAPEEEISDEAAPVVTEAAEHEAVQHEPLLIEEGGIIAIFLEEATEVLERCDTLLNTWRDKLSDGKLVQNLQREIHTFKGGARMAGLEGLGNLSHAMETLLEHIASRRLEATVAAVQALEEGCDSLNVWVEQIQSGRLPKTEKALQRFEKKVSALPLPGMEEAVEAEEQLQPPAEAPLDAPAAGESDETREVQEEKAPVEKAPAPVLERAAAPSPAQAIPSKPALSKEPAREFQEIVDRPAAASGDDTAAGAQIRVAADLMDKLVNYAGEISIYRSRLEQQLGSVRFNLKEVDATVSRLKEQLRKMDIESEAQMMSRYQSASTKGSSEFDPLELDRFSNMQQLSRALAESVSDLLNLHDMLEDSVRQAESLLTQQSRVSSDLQEGLMQTRMTPFGSAAPRLRRVVRAAAKETGKEARLQLRMAGSSDQLDRNVLERITAPLEHLLRNAVAHGIEKPKDRRKAKKEEEGTITVTVEAETTEFVIRVQDDGAGIDLDAVRKRAIERGMIDAKDQIDPQRLVEFVRKSGFSTSTSVTGLSGRGVGMDVVNSEVKQIGGSLEIDTERGRGTRFTIRIPFSLAVMQAIGVQVGERPFQIPLNSVAGVARMTPSEFTALVKGQSPTYEFAGEKYPLLELEPLLDAPPMPLDSDNVSLLMIRSGEHRAAFRVSDLQGHQEVVIKPVGPQISSIPGILGGTIAADGQVMILLDMGPLIRRGLERAELPSEPALSQPSDSRQPLVMVVDDSITMRKVTSRVLDNHSIEVMTAKDGVDAIEQLHERVPDLLLLDIEMPRMDGYELLEHVRADARLRHVPVVMITSRAGQKHRKKARKAGANAYLTKPYQEAELIESVGDLLQMELVPRRVD